jgi:SAM-dependent methyltransferase
MTEQEILVRYRKIFHLTESIGFEHVERHRELEAKLTQRLLSTTPEDRCRVFEECYTTLFRTLPWLNEPPTNQLRPKDVALSKVLKQHSLIFEVGSGKGRLARALVESGHRCVATEVTAERGQKHVSNVEGLEWRSTNGVNLARYEPENTYDYVVSSNLVEHLHPDDIQCHFENVRMILKPGGEYMLETPHAGTGPCDLSAVFGLERPCFMHLREYSYLDIARIAKAAGFQRIEAMVFTTGLMTRPLKSRNLFHYYCFVDQLLSVMKLPHKRERQVRRLFRFALVPSMIWLAIQK